jgi:CheY-like chemotaxis protein
MKVLLIEDNKDIADMVRLCLESENIVCEATGDGKVGSQLIKEDKFDVILLDLAIPEFSGFDIFRSLKEVDWRDLLCYPLANPNAKPAETLDTSGIPLTVITCIYSPYAA